MPQQESKFKTFIRENLLTTLTVVGVIGGTILGLVLRDLEGQWTPRQVVYLQFPGDIFLRMLKSLIVPLLVSSIVSAIGSLDLSMSGKIGMRSVVYYMTTTVCAVILGIILVCSIRPGVGGHVDTDDGNPVEKRNVLTADTLLDLIRNVFPSNLIQACLFQYRTILLEPPNATEDTPLTDYIIKSEYAEGTNVLGLVMFSIIMGITISKMGVTAKPVQDFFQALSEAMMIITSWVIWISPIGVFFLVTAKLLEIKSFHQIVGQLGWYFLTVLLGLILHGFGTLSVIFFVTTKRLPFRAIGKMGQVLATAFGTASSSATMPITIGCCDDMGLDPRITRFVIPIGATINMDGTALYEAVAAIFIAQLRGISLSVGNIIAISVTATAASIGAAGIPQAGLVTMVMVLDTVGLPAKDVTIIIAVDWLLDRFRTTINVMCDALGAIIIAAMSEKDMERQRADERDRVNAQPHELAELGKAEL